jgi:predicted phosphoribosyltransferase
MIFENRRHAALLLSHHLKKYQGEHPLILAIPRGGVPLGAVLANQLQGQLDVVLVRKLGAPLNPEFALGAVSESGKVYIAPYVENTGAKKDYLDQEIAKQLELIKRRRKQYNEVLKPISPKGRTVIVVDDGLATGATMIAALTAVKELLPQKIICAIPVAPTRALLELQPYCDDIVCLESRDDFQSVGEFYAEFGQVEDQDVVEMLRASLI